MVLSESTGTFFPAGFIDTNIPNLKIFTIQPADKIKEYRVKKTGESKLRIELDFIDGIAAGETISLSFTPDKETFTPNFWLKDGQFSAQIKIPEKVDVKALESTQAMGGAVAAAGNAVGGAADSSSLILSILSIDASGHLMKLAMMGKIFSRFRFLDVNYGLFLDSYFDAAGENHDPPSKSEQFLVEHNK